MRENLGKHYAGNAGETYSGWQVNATTGLGRLVAPKFAPYISPNDTVLDFGCGSGENISSIECKERIGIEPNPASFAHLERKNIKGYQDPAEVPAASADVVMSHHALEHCLSPYNELKELRRIVRPSGKLVLVLPIDDWRNQRRYDATDINHHLYTWTPLLIGNLLEEVGFEVVETRVRTYQWPPRVRFLSTNLPAPLFKALCWFWSIATRMREILVVARPK